MSVHGLQQVFTVVAFVLASCGADDRQATQAPTVAASAGIERSGDVPVQPHTANPRIILGRARVVLERSGVGSVTVPVEVAATEPLRRRGLMYRRSMPRDAGMLFVFDEPDLQSFWMRNTFLRLDLIFIGADHRVVGIVENATPLTDDPRAIDAHSQYVLEVHGGFTAEHAIALGSTVRFEGLSEE